MPGRFFFKVCGLEGPIMTGPVILNTFMFDLLSCSVRITPARVGTTETVFLSVSVHQDHPRSRGDHIESAILKCGLKGSPPLARGPQGSLLDHLQPVGITPARAGTTFSYRA